MTQVLDLVPESLHHKISCAMGTAQHLEDFLLLGKRKEE
jgi:fructose-1,6-bisphosphatase